MSGKLLGHLARRGTRTCSCCDFSNSARSWKRIERRRWQRDWDGWR